MKAGKPNNKDKRRHKSAPKPEKQQEVSDEIRLNRYISLSGLCSRRGADELIAKGRVKVNGKTVKEMGLKVKRQDKVLVDNKLISPEKKQYVLLNKPKGVICTRKDEKDRKTVMDLLPPDLRHLYPVGRLDRNTTGVLLITNDGDLTQKLLHPSKKVKKVYKATLNKQLTQEEMDALVKGVELEDGRSAFDKLVELREDDLPRFGVEIHSGKNRIVRRMFESCKAEVLKLDRVLFHTIERRGLNRGEWRHLREKELRSLGVKIS